MRRAAVPLLACALLAAVALLLTVRSTFAPPPGPGARAPAAGAPSAVRVDGADAGTAPAAAAAGDAAAADARTASAAVLDYAAERTGYRGRVVAARSLQPVPGMNVTLCRGAPDLALPPGVSVFARAPIEPQIVAARARTGADGRFQLDGVLPRGLCFLRLEFPDVTQAPPPWRGGQGTTVPVQRTPAPGEVVDLGDLPLKPGATLLGRVVDGQGPVAGATVRAARLPPVPFGAVPVERLRPDGALLVTAAGIRSVIELPRWVADVLAELPIPTSSTAADGTFALYGVDPGVNVVAATAPQHASLLRQGLAVEPDATQALGDLELPAGEEVEIAVADPSGAPIAGAEVLVAPQSTGVPVHIAERAGRTDGDGRVRVRGLPRGSALAAARRSPKEEWVVGEPAPVDGEVRVTLPAAFALTLRCRVRSRSLRPTCSCGSSTPRRTRAPSSCRCSGCCAASISTTACAGSTTGGSASSGCAPARGASSSAPVAARRPRSTSSCAPTSTAPCSCGPRARCACARSTPTARRSRRQPSTCSRAAASARSASSSCRSRRGAPTATAGAR